MDEHIAARSSGRGEADCNLEQSRNGGDKLGPQCLCEYSARKAAGARGWEAARRKEKKTRKRVSCCCVRCNSPWSNSKYRKNEVRKYVMRKTKQIKKLGFVEPLESPLEMSRREPANDQEVARDALEGCLRDFREPMELVHFIIAAHNRLEARLEPSPASFEPLERSHSVSSTLAPTSLSWECVDGSFDIESIDDADLL